MTFDYSVYFRQNCVVPLGLAGFCLIVCIIAFVSFFKDRGKHLDANGVVIIAIVLFLLSINLVPLFRGGIHLLYEKETDQIQVTGTIEKTMGIDFFTGAKYDTENNNGNGEIIVVNGKKYYLMTYGDFGVGDDVVLDVLPRSGFVLKMEIAEPTD